MKIVFNNGKYFFFQIQLNLIFTSTSKYREDVGHGNKNTNRRGKINTNL